MCARKRNGVGRDVHIPPFPLPPLCKGRWPEGLEGLPLILYIFSLQIAPPSGMICFTEGSKGDFLGRV